MAAPFQSWGRYPQAQQSVQRLRDRFSTPEFPPDRSVLAHGMGRSYGDSCLNEGGTLLYTRSLDHYIAFDEAQGILSSEAGVLFAEILQLVVPRGWFIPAVPGTQFITVGGAIANDVHGKNHHRAGTFGAHLIEFELLRSDGSVLQCSPQQNAEMFRATIGGLGLTGLIRRASFRLAKIPGSWVRGEDLKFSGLAEFFRLSAESDRDYEYTVAWVDCTSRGSALGRGIFSRGNHADVRLPEQARLKLKIPLTPPVSLVNNLSVHAFNMLNYARKSAAVSPRVWQYQPFFFPLDGILDWNRMYGPRGFFQYQCVVPHADAQAGIAEMLGRIARAGQGSFLAVLKTFGDTVSPGMLSFPRPGVTLAIDFPNGGEKTLALLEQLDEVTRAAGGAVYPAKDARMSAASFQQYFPQWREFSQYIDPKFSSSFWRRVTS